MDDPSSNLTEERLDGNDGVKDDDPKGLEMNNPKKE